MTRDRDIGVFDARAGSYESGWIRAVTART
jgi:hypothetical protein